VANLGIVAEPFLPFSAARVNEMLNLTPQTWLQSGSDDLLTAGHALGVSGLLFEKIEDSVIAQQLQKLHNKKKSMEPVTHAVAPLKSEILYDDFAKLDIPCWHRPDGGKKWRNPRNY